MQICSQGKEDCQKKKPSKRNHTVINTTMENTNEKSVRKRKKRVKMTGPLVCQNCGKIFEDQPKLVRHMRRVHPPEDKMCLCNICNKTFKTKGMLNDHKEKVHSFEDNVSCDICSKKFKNRYRLRLHMKVVHVHHIDKLPRKQCELCGKDFRNITLLHQHVKRVHTNPTQCKICLKELKSSIYLRRHMINVHLTQSRKCEYCSKEFKDKYCYATHLKKNHPSEYLSHKGYREYQNNCNGEDVTEQCKVCSSHFKSKMALYYHLQREHNADNNEIEALESFQEEFKKNLYKPKRKPKETSELSKEIYPKKRKKEIVRESEKKKCELCPKTLKNELTLKLHVIRCHKIEHVNNILEVSVDGAEFSEDDCKPLFEYKTVKTEIIDVNDLGISDVEIDDVLEDIEEVVVDVKPELVYNKAELPEDCESKEDPKALNSIIYSCNDCREGFSKMYNLKRHIKLHSNKSLHPVIFCCNRCGRSFDSKADLKKHKREVHITEEECVCSVCSKKLISAENLRRHMINRHSHTKWACETCGKIFGSKTKLCQHVRYAHPRENAKTRCEDCKKDFKSRIHLKDHMKSVHSLGSSTSICDICSKEYKNIIRLRKHVAKAHNTAKMAGKPFMCKYCKKMFKTQFYMARHIKYLHESEVSYSCEECSKVFPSEAYLKSHVGRMHSIGSLSPTLSSG